MPKSEGRGLKASALNRYDVGIGESSPFNNLANLDCYRLTKHRASNDNRMKFTILAAGIVVWRKLRNQFA